MFVQWDSFLFQFFTQYVHDINSTLVVWSCTLFWGQIYELFPLRQKEKLHRYTATPLHFENMIVSAT